MKHSQKTFFSLVLAACFVALWAHPGRTASTAPTSVHFFAFGDWGSGSKNQRAVADRIQQVCGERQCDFGLSLGDDFYSNGVSSVNDPQWQTKFRDMYGALKIPFYSALGNHDVRGNTQAQIDYSKIDPQWRMPNEYYSFRYPKEGKPLLEIFVLNSNDFSRTSQDWLQQAIQTSVATWKLVDLHHPILNNGTGHPADEKKIYSKLEPLICHKIDLLLSGHEHIVSHLTDQKAQDCGWEQIISGTGGMSVYGIKSKLPADYQVFFAEAAYGFAFFEASPQELKLSFIRADGSSPYQHVWTKP